VGPPLASADFTRSLVQGRYGHELRVEAERSFFGGGPDLFNAAPPMVEAIWWQTPGSEKHDSYQRAGESLLELLTTHESRTRCQGALGFVRLCFEIAKALERSEDIEVPTALHSAGPALQALLFSEELHEQFAATLALVWFGECRISPPPAEPDLLGRLFALWLHGSDPQLKEKAVWALASQPLATSREGECPCSSIDRAELDGLLERYDHLDEPAEQLSALVSAWYLRALDDPEIAQRAWALADDQRGKQLTHSTLRDLVERVGEPALDRPVRQPKKPTRTRKPRNRRPSRS